MLAIIIVSWNVRELLARCLRATAASLAAGGLDAEIIVVDNASHDGTPAMLRAEFPRVRLIEAGANIGFAAGNNLALRALGLGRPGGGPALVLLLNPDTEPLGDALPQLVRFMQAHPQAAAVGPRLRYGDGSPQPSRRRFPTPATMLWESTPLERRWPANPWAARYRCADVPEGRAQPVGWLVGAALLVRGAAIRRAGLLDARYFMYSEELEWQWRLQRDDPRPPPPTRASAAAAERSGQIWYLPSAEITHHEGKSSEQALVGRHRHFQQSRLLLARSWYGWPAAAALRAAIRLGYASDLAAEAAKLALGHRPALRRQRIGVYRQILRDL